MKQIKGVQNLPTQAFTHLASGGWQHHCDVTNILLVNAVDDVPTVMITGIALH